MGVSKILIIRQSLTGSLVLFESVFFTFSRISIHGLADLEPNVVGVLPPSIVESNLFGGNLEGLLCVVQYHNMKFLLDIYLC